MVDGLPSEVVSGRGIPSLGGEREKSQRDRDERELRWRDSILCLTFNMGSKAPRRDSTESGDEISFSPAKGI